MSDIFTATGTKIFIGPSVTNTTDTAAEFAALSWTEIGLVESIGEFGDQASMVTGAVIGDGRMRKARGARDAGELAISRHWKRRRRPTPTTPSRSFCRTASPSAAPTKSGTSAAWWRRSALTSAATTTW